MHEKMQMSNLQELEAESDDVIRFDNSLKELKSLRSQLHHAADYCEATFLNAKQKTLVIENTKEYLSRAVVTVIDHLGNVSANLDCCISKTNEFSDAELRINSLKQRLLSCEQYAHKLALTKVRWSANLPRHHRRYLSTPITYVEGSNEDLRDSDSPAFPKIIDKHEFDTQDVPLFLYTHPHRSSSAKNLPSRSTSQKEDSSSASVLPVRDGSNPTFHFQLGTPKHGRNSLFRKSVHGTDHILSLIRRIKRTT